MTARLCCFPKCNHALKSGTPRIQIDSRHSICQGVIPFPNDAETRRLWLERCKIGEISWGSGMRLCPCHFECTGDKFDLTIPAAEQPSFAVDTRKRPSLPKRVNSKSLEGGISAREDNFHFIRHRCRVPGCGHSVVPWTSQYAVPNPCRGYRRFPKDPVIRLQWIKNCRRSELEVTSSWKVCICHFACCEKYGVNTDHEHLPTKNLPGGLPSSHWFNEGMDLDKAAAALEAKQSQLAAEAKKKAQVQKRRKETSTLSSESTDRSTTKSAWHVPVDPNLTSVLGEPMDLEGIRETSPELPDARPNTEDIYVNGLSRAAGLASIGYHLDSKVDGAQPASSTSVSNLSRSAMFNHPEAVAYVRHESSPRVTSRKRKPVISVRNIGQLRPSKSISSAPHATRRENNPQVLRALETEKERNEQLVSTLEALRTKHASVKQLGNFATDTKFSLPGMSNGDVFFLTQKPENEKAEDEELRVEVPGETEVSDVGKKPQITLANLRDDRVHYLVNYPKATICALAELLSADGQFVAIDSETEPKFCLEDEVLMTLVKLRRDESYPVMGYHWGLPRGKVEEIVEAVMGRMHSVLYAAMVEKARSMFLPKKGKRFEAVKSGRIMLTCKNLNVWGDEKCDISCNKRSYFSVAFGLASDEIFCRFEKLSLQENSGKAAIHKAANSLEEKGFRFLDIFPPGTSLEGMNGETGESRSKDLLSSDMVAVYKKKLSAILRLAKSFKILELKDKGARDRAQMLWEVCVGIVGARARLGWATELEVKIRNTKRKKKKKEWPPRN